MSYSPIPDHFFIRLTDITPAFLISRGVTLLMADLDNTISPYGKADRPTDEMLTWVHMMKQARIELFIVSNNKSDRPKVFADALDIPYVKRARKPFSIGVKKALQIAGKKPQDAALAGDQIYTDVMAANGCGVLSILIEPLCLRNPILAVRYFFELPFRALARKKHKISRG
ncbi:MAG: YqeG family HAD IIIA-type phosphatase [Oscillospiraceae bacterium]